VRAPAVASATTPSFERVMVGALAPLRTEEDLLFDMTTTPVTRIDGLVHFPRNFRAKSKNQGLRGL
jgi:hypothetical protein